MKNSKRLNAHSVLVFSKWAGKKFSLFNTLHKIVVIAVLSVTYFISAPIISIAQQPDTTETKTEYDLDEIEVSAKRAPAVYSQVARVITVIEAKDIEKMPAQSVEELLEYIAGADIRQRGADAVQSDLSIRGGTFDQTLILLNGINITDPQTGHHNLNLPVSLEQIESIEIIEGPAARVYGPNAFSGAVNIVTKKPGKNNINLTAAAGSHHYYNTTLSTGFTTGNINHLLAAGRKSSKGYINNTDFILQNLFYTNRLNTKSGLFDMQAGISGKAFGANSFYTPKYPDQFEETSTLFGSAKWESLTRLHITPIIYWRRHFDRFELFRDEAPDWYTNHNYHRTTTFGAGINSWFQWRLGKTAFGTEYRAERILSNVLGEEMENTEEVRGESAIYTHSKSRNVTSVFLEHSWYYNKWIATAGIMGNHISDKKSGLNFFPGLEISFELLPNLKIFSAYNTSLRMPTFTDLYYKGPTNLGNPDLKHERSATIEGGLKFMKPVLNGNIVVFYREGKDIIDWTKIAGEEIWRPRNLTQINSFGFVAQMQLDLKKQFGKNLPDKLMMSYFYNNINKEQGDFISNYVLDNLKHKLVFILNQQFLNNCFINISAIFQDREGTFTFFENLQPMGEKGYSPFWIFNLKAGYQINNLQVFGSAKNIFDKKYYDLGNVVQPGRWLKAGIVYNLNFD